MLGLISVLTLITAVTASAATLSMESSTLGVFTAPAEIELPPLTGTGDLTCDIDLGRDPPAVLRWEPAPPPVDAYRIAHQGPILGVWHGLTEVDAGTTEYPLRPSFLRHRYAVASIAGDQQSEWSTSHWVHCKPGPAYHLAGALEGVEHHSQRTIALDWSPDQRSQRYVVLRGTQPGGPYEVVAAISSDSYEDQTVADGVTYYYRLVGVDGLGMESEPSNEVEVVDQLAGEHSTVGDEPETSPIQVATPILEPTPPAEPTPEPTSEPTPTPQPEG